jgi:hypothetical protein
MINTDIILNNFTIYIQGNTNTGKTTSVINLLKKENFDYTYTSIQLIKDEDSFIKMTQNRNILMLMKNKNLNNIRIIVIDNIDYLQNSDKKILSILIKILKDKSFKTKHKNLRIIFIGINNNDKKVLELMNIVSKIIKYNNYSNLFFENDKNTKQIIKSCLDKTYDVNSIYNEKTIISLCYHENIIHFIQDDYTFYLQFLINFSYGDYFDRLSFQKQLWQFNEMTFFIKVIDNHNLFLNKNFKQNNNNEIIFTKILTKYSNEYSNQNFIISICDKLNIQKEELYNYLINDVKIHILPIEKKRIIKLLL